MGFNVSYSIRTLTVFEIQLLSASDIVTAFCPVGDIILTADVSDEDLLDGHTLLWEQVAGTAVTLLNPASLVTSFPFGDTVDKTFRFYIDKGLPGEQYKDVYVYYTPTTVGARGSCVGTVTLGKGPGDVAENIFANAGPGAPVTGDFIDNVVPNPGVELTWDAPSGDLADDIIKYEVYKDAILQSTYYPGDALSFNGGPGTYIIKSYFDFQNNIINNDEVFDAASFFPANTVYHTVDDVASMESTISKSYNTIVRFTISKRNETDIVPQGSTSEAVINFARFTNKVQIPDLDIVPQGTMSDSFINITRTNPSGVGSGA